MPPHFKYAMCNETFGDWPFEKAVALVAERGGQGIVMNVQRFVLERFP